MRAGVVSMPVRVVLRRGTGTGVRAPASGARGSYEILVDAEEEPTGLGDVQQALVFLVHKRAAAVRPQRDAGVRMLLRMRRSRLV